MTSKAGHGDCRRKECRFPEGRYELRTYEGSRMKYKPVGTNAADAVAAQQRETKLLAARENAEAAGAKIIEESSRRYLRRSFETTNVTARIRTL